MLELMKKLRMLVGNDNHFSSVIYDDCIIFELWEVEVPLIFTKDMLYLDCELYDYKLYPNMIDDIQTALEYIEEARGELIELLEVGDGK